MIPIRGAAAKTPRESDPRNLRCAQFAGPAANRSTAPDQQVVRGVERWVYNGATPRRLLQRLGHWPLGSLLGYQSLLRKLSTGVLGRLARISISVGISYLASLSTKKAVRSSIPNGSCPGLSAMKALAD